ncbi:MAG: dihydroorotase [Tannerella sp.]|jgi:dihydroorotase|nr:dihydroorotase [Tannerella sp.]
MKKIIGNALIINEGRSFIGSVVIDGAFITDVVENNDALLKNTDYEVIDATGKWVLPGVIDDQVHFREPGLTHKGDIASESRAAVAGGVTTFMDMPNTKPQTVTVEDWEWKNARAAETSLANYSFFFGGTNTNAHIIKQLDRRYVPGIKLFLGASTGNMLVDSKDALKDFFSQTDFLVAVHAEKEDIIRINTEYYIQQYGDNLAISFHPLIRSAEACYASSSEAAELAVKLGTRLHIFHLSTARELSLLDGGALNQRKITGEVCVHHLWFSDADYQALGAKIKWNPAIKTLADRDALRKAVKDSVLTVVATDHAPHLLEEKQGSCLKASSGGPLIQHSLVAMLELSAQGCFSREKVVAMMCHNPAELFRIDRRGYIKQGYYADLVIVDPSKPLTVTPDNILYKCGWSPFEGITFRHSVEKTFINGNEIFSKGTFFEKNRGMKVEFKA